MAYYVFDDKNNKAEAYTKEQFLSLLEQIIEDQSLAGVTADSGFITKIKSIVDNTTYSIAFCTQATYNTMEQGGTLQANTLYFITDDTTAGDLATAISNIDLTLTTAVNNIQTLQADVAPLKTKLTGNYVLKKTSLSNPTFSALYQAILTNYSKIDRVIIKPTVSRTINGNYLSLAASSGGGTVTMSQLSNSITLGTNDTIVLYPTTYYNNDFLRLIGGNYILELNINSDLSLKYNSNTDGEVIGSSLAGYIGITETITSGNYNASTYPQFNVDIYTREV